MSNDFCTITENDIAMGDLGIFLVVSIKVTTDDVIFDRKVIFPELLTCLGIVG